MSRIAYVNGRYVRHREASVHVEDRGYQFADGVYEVIAVYGGRLIDGGAHLDRLERSLGELAMTMPMARGPLGVVIDETVRRNGVRDGIVYLQVSRGVARRDHPFPDGVKPALVVTARRATFPGDPDTLVPGAVITAPDIRWGRCDIKSISLLPNVLARQQAIAAGAYETWQVDRDGRVTEGSATNAWIVDREGRVATREKGPAILGGITRERLIGLARDAGVAVDERPFTVDEAKAAREAFITSTTNFVKPITRIDDTVVANGEPGETTRRLLALYLAFVRGEGADDASTAALVRGR